jgi:hypothetical protein
LSLFLVVPVLFTDVADWSDAGRGFFIFIGLLPLINGVFDFLSYGATLRLLRWGMAGELVRSVFAGLVDLAVALLIFTGLGLSMIAVIGVLNQLGTAPLLPLSPIFTRWPPPRAGRSTGGCS